MTLQSPPFPVPTLASRFPAFGSVAPSYVAPGVVAVKVAGRGAQSRFFDTPPVSPSGRYVALFRFPYDDREPAPGDAGDIVLVDLHTATERVVATSRGWEIQLGANVQWGATDHDLFFNDVDPADWSAFAVHLDPLTGDSRRLGGTVFMASPDGRTLASHNLYNSRRAQSGYGVVVPDAHCPRNLGPSDSDGLTLTDVATGRARRIVTLRELYDRAVPSFREEGVEGGGHEFYGFQVKWNPQGTRLLTTVQWHVPGKDRRRVVLTLRPDGTDVRTAVTADQWARGGHHINWDNDGDHLTMNLAVGETSDVSLVRFRYDGADLTVLHPQGSGHPSAHPTLPYLVTDAYPSEPITDRDGTSPIRLIDRRDGSEVRVAKVPLANGRPFHLRVDAHPAWDRTGRLIVFNGLEPDGPSGGRCVYLADVSALLNP